MRKSLKILTVGLLTPFIIQCSGEDSSFSLSILFISEQIPFELTTEFIERVTEQSACKTSAIVMLVDPLSNYLQDVSGTLEAGFDGFLTSPFSAEGLEEIIALAERVKSEKERILGNLKLAEAIQELLECVDYLACHRLSSAEEQEALEKVKLRQEQLQETIVHNMGDYFQLTSKFAAEREINWIYSRLKRFGGVSQKSKRLVHGKLLDKFGRKLKFSDSETDV